MSMNILNSSIQYLMSRNSWNWPPTASTENSEILTAIQRPLISHEEIQNSMPYAFGAPTICTNMWKDWIEHFGYKHIEPLCIENLSNQNKIEAREFCFFDIETGLKVALFEKDQQLLILFGALNSSKTEVNKDQSQSHYIKKVVIAASYNLIWGKPLLFQRAFELVSQLKEHSRFINMQFVLTGQSLGGGIATYVGLKLQLETICFNSLPLGTWVKREIDQATLNLAHRNIKQIIIESDWLSDNLLLKKMSSVFSYVVSLPHLYGEKKYVPTAFPNDVIESHAHIISSLTKFINIAEGLQPSQIASAMQPSKL